MNKIQKAERQINVYSRLNRHPRLGDPREVYMKQMIETTAAKDLLWIEHRTPDRKAWVRCPMPPNTLRVHLENVLVKSVGPKVLWAESRVQGTGEYFPPLQSHGKIVEVGIGFGAIYRPFGEFLRSKSYCRLYGAQGLGQHDRRTSSPLPQ
ncbi:uncharacterized protein TNCV_4594591 [Trichonephila clavipes]|uniref:Uncharacterized protein n=1 Tax=Trichonephila clavipes TaxID=2585209 RepID=A0A8X6WFS2_TRICX|nr:uncharacterized protein TNCV_4594591 [Trichonephila clavipes]